MDEDCANIEAYLTVTDRGLCCPQPVTRGATTRRLTGPAPSTHNESGLSVEKTMRKKIIHYLALVAAWILPALAGIGKKE